ncbi:hypothetical protein GXP67_00740 [Rhodocytophaga rosea]|uniref:Uncharacterized protein n=1 Tax=Rhodocytophaga rosea TaxID=2704465 RepID=A0A6C0GBW0_9BACT|nr:hypothetical protein [Rhodocytophaga rosea]QHT65302.1 hypothetical protein GXP67_00740 [Rhodocytophaga rosea]
MNAKVFIANAERLMGQDTTDIFILAQTKQLLKDFFGANNHFLPLVDQALPSQLNQFYRLPLPMSGMCIRSSRVTTQTFINQFLNHHTMQKVVTVFIKTDEKTARTESYYKHEDIQDYLKREFPKEEYFVKDIQTVGIAPYLAVTYILEQKEESKYGYENSDAIHL